MNFTLFIFPFVASVFASDAYIVSVNVATSVNLPKVQVYEFWDGKSSLFSTRKQQPDPRWKLVGPAFCTAAAAPVGDTKWTPLAVWTKFHSALNAIDNCYISDDELGATRGLAIGSMDYNPRNNPPLDYRFLGNLGYVATEKVEGTVPLHRYWMYYPNQGIRGKHHFSITPNESKRSIKGQQTLDPKDNDTYGYEKIAGYVWDKCN